MTLRLIAALSLTFALQQTAAPPAPAAPKGTTPTACLQEVREFTAARTKALPPTGASQAAVTAAAMQADLQKARAQIQTDKIALARACGAQFDVTKAPSDELTNLSLLYTEANQTDLAKAAIERAISLKGQPPAARAATLTTAINTILREPKGDERNARLEKLVDELDTLPDEFADAKFSAHLSMNGYYRSDDIDAGIIKHSTWLIESAKSCDPSLAKKYGPRVVFSYIDMAEAFAGQGMNDKALDLLNRAAKELPDVPNVAAAVAPTIARYKIVGTKAAAIDAPVWLNAPAGTTSMPMTGKVTLLEFSAHWCGPCRESYPGINRLRATYASKGFQVVIATELYGYFSTERPLAPEAEIERDKGYFAEHQLDVPVAIGPKIAPATRNADGTSTYHRDPNADHYQVGGIPQIHIIDKHGTIRLIMVGDDDANEPKLAKFIESLLAEK